MTTIRKCSWYGVRTGRPEIVYSSANLRYLKLYDRLIDILLGQVSSDQNFAVCVVLVLFKKSGNAKKRQVCGTYGYECIDHDDTSE